MNKLKRLLLAPFLLGLIPSANAGIYIYPFFNDGIEVRCADNEPKHLISFKAGRVMKFEIMEMININFQRYIYIQRKLISNTLIFQVQQVQNVVTENLQEKREKIIEKWL